MGQHFVRPIILLMPVSCILLAAGASRRLGQPKQLVRLGGETLLERSVRLALLAGCERVFVVLGAQAERIRAEMDGEIAAHSEVTLLVNEQWEQGIASSIRAGAARLRQDGSASGALLMACDQPFLTVEHLRLLLAAFAERGEREIAASLYGDTLGIPAVFPRSRFTDLLALRGDRGARHLLRQEPQLVTVACAAAALDVDTPEDLARLNQQSNP